MNGATDGARRARALKDGARGRRARAFGLAAALICAMVATTLCGTAAAAEQTVAAAAEQAAIAPTTLALRAVQVVTGLPATFAFRVDDESATEATVKIVVTDAAGKALRTVAVSGAVRTNKDLTRTWRCTLPAGVYRYHVEAVDSLGQAQSAAKAARLVVLPVFPAAAAIRDAAAWVAQRHSLSGFAVIDDRGVLGGYHLDVQFPSASVVKAMMLVRYLRTHAALSSSMRAELSRMIIISDNTAASDVFRRVGAAGCRAVARLAGMTHFSVGSDWALARITAADQARLFFAMDSFVPPQYRIWVRYLFSHITPAHRWGIPEVAGPAGWRWFFKGGYMPVGNGIVVHEASRLERDGVSFALVILTQGQESLDYGVATLKGATARVLGTAPKAADLR